MLPSKLISPVTQTEYEPSSVISESTNAEIYDAFNGDGDEVVLKVFKQPSHEPMLLQRTNHKNIVKCFEVFEFEGH